MKLSVFCRHDGAAVMLKTSQLLKSRIHFSFS